MIRVDHFRKTFRTGFRRKRSVAARDISFEVVRGEVFGFLGPNGAGKTTTIKALLNLIRADGGSLTLVGHDVRSMAWRSAVGYMPEHPNFYDYLTGFEVVVWFGRLAGLSRHEAEQQARKNLERVGLAHACDRRLRGYSKGMLQRAGLAQALMGSPQLLVLDEPMTGLDPIGRRDMRDLILALRDEGCTIFYSTHILSDVEMTCDRVSIIHQGVTQRTGRLSEFLSETEKVSVVVRPSPASGATLVERYALSEMPDGTWARDFEDIDRARAFVTEASALGMDLLRFEPRRETLEAIFMRALGTDSGEKAFFAPDRKEARSATKL
ncbi:MAG: ABC transporter ATP-binding protein [Deltaproteobacteria bacterium]|nr:ABC transporter ATP-binding protein [Deltaproteobacteria bacterium]